MSANELTGTNTVAARPRLAERLRAAAAQCQELGATWADRLNRRDMQELVAAFHRAESLAEAALVAAIEVARLEHKADLVEQLAEERRHVAVFADLGGIEERFDAPPPRGRPEHVTLARLLANELAGYCQFHLLLGIYKARENTASAASAQIESILVDEEKHVARLDGWLDGARASPKAIELASIRRGFCGKLPARMRGFLPRAELAPLATGMALAISTLVQATI